MSTVKQNVVPEASGMVQANLLDAATDSIPISDLTSHRRPSLNRQ